MKHRDKINYLQLLYVVVAVLILGGAGLLFDGGHVLVGLMLVGVGLAIRKALVQKVHELTESMPLEEHRSSPVILAAGVILALVFVWLFIQNALGRL